jgi:hypothetical protein
MSPGVEEGNLAFVGGDVISADMLRDAAGFDFRDSCFPDDVKQRCLSVIDMPHYRDHR